MGGADLNTEVLWSFGTLWISLLFQNTFDFDIFPSDFESIYIDPLNSTLRILKDPQNKRI